jgi:hypothetical protein
MEVAWSKLRWKGQKGANQGAKSNIAMILGGNDSGKFPLLLTRCQHGRPANGLIGRGLWLATELGSPS